MTVCHWTSKCFNGDRESEEDVAVEGECEHETTLFTPASVDPASCHMHVSASHSLQPALICAPATDRDLDSCRWLKCLEKRTSAHRGL